MAALGVPTTRALSLVVGRFPAQPAVLMHQSQTTSSFFSPGSEGYNAR